jgi:hypothetical protein
MCSLLIAAVRLCLLYWAVSRLVAPDGLLLLLGCFAPGCARWAAVASAVAQRVYFVGLINLIAAECQQLPTE